MAAATPNGNPGINDPSQLFAILASMATAAGATGSNPFPGSNQGPPQAQAPYMQPQAPNMGLFNFPGTQMPMFQQPQAQSSNSSIQGIMNMIMAEVACTQPIGMYPNDEEILIQALSESESKDISYKAAIDTLHKTNNHSMGQWKDYYLEHKSRLDRLIEEHRADSNKSAKGKGRQIKKRSASPPLHRTVRKPSAYSRGLAPPSPPRHPKQLSNGRYKFTTEDRSFMLKFLQWRLRDNFTSNETQLARELANRARHHPPTTWRHQMAKDHDAVQKVMNKSREEYRREARVRVSSSDEESEEGEDGSEGEEDEDEDEGLNESDDDESEYAETDEDDDLKGMSDAGQRINDEDRRVIARYVAAHDKDDWEAVGSSKSRWEEFADEHPQRSIAAWAEAYRNHKQDIDPLIKQYRKRKQSTSSTRHTMQTGRPSWAGGSSSSLKKRKSGVDDGYRRHRKRAK